MRDPALVRSPDGDQYWIIATDLCIGCGQSWGDAVTTAAATSSCGSPRDLVNWSAPWLLNVAGAIPGGRNAWAPEAIWNPATDDYVLYWATNAPLNGVTKHRIYYARTSDFRTLTTPQIYIDRGPAQEIIDTQIIEVPGRRRRLPLLPGLRRRPDHHRGQQLDPRHLDQPRQPLRHRPAPAATWSKARCG